MNAEHLSGRESDIIVPALVVLFPSSRLSPCHETKASTFKRGGKKAVIYAADYAKQLRFCCGCIPSLIEEGGKKTNK